MATPWLTYARAQGMWTVGQEGCGTDIVWKRVNTTRGRDGFIQNQTEINQTKQIGKIYLQGKYISPARVEFAS